MHCQNSSLSAFRVMVCSWLICRKTVNLAAIWGTAPGMTNRMPCKDVNSKLEYNMQVEMARVSLDILRVVHLGCCVVLVEVEPSRDNLR